MARLWRISTLFPWDTIPFVAHYHSPPNTANQTQDNKKPKISPVAAWQKFIEAKGHANRNKDYVRNFRWQLELFWDGFESLDSPGPDEIAQWCRKHSKAATSYATILKRFHAFFRWCIKRGWIAHNPADSVDYPTVEYGRPSTLTLDQVRIVAKACLPELKPWLVCALWLGMRPSEAMRISPEHVDVKRKLLMADKSKIHRWRSIPIPDNVLPALSVKFQPLKNKRYIVNRQVMRKALGFKVWPQDVLRHTAASMWLAKYQDAGKVALWLGNSPKILLTHYRDLVAPDVAEEFFKIEV